jgi:uncharacterized membrane protein
MSQDNITPFRPRRPPPKPPGAGGIGLNTPRGKAVAAQALTLAAFAFSFFLPGLPWSLIGLAIGVAGFFIAASNRQAPMPWARTHHEHALRTLLFGGSIWTLASMLQLISPFLSVATFVIWIAVLVWVAVRAGVGLVFAVMRKPITRPTGFLF